MQTITNASTKSKNIKQVWESEEVSDLTDDASHYLKKEVTNSLLIKSSSKDWMQMYSRCLENKMSLFALESIVAKRMELLMWIDQLMESPFIKNFEILLSTIANRLPDERKYKHDQSGRMRISGDAMQNSLDTIAENPNICDSMYRESKSIIEEINIFENSFNSSDNHANRITGESEKSKEQCIAINKEEKIVFAVNEDLISHILCRYAFCMSDKWRSWFVKLEEVLMRARIRMEIVKNPFTFLVALMKQNGLPCVPLTEKEKSDNIIQEYISYRASLGEFSKESESVLGNYYSVPLSLTTRLTKARKILCYNGKAILFRDQVEEVFIAVYRGKLYRNLHNAYLWRTQALLEMSPTLHTEEEENNAINDDTYFSSSENFVNNERSKKNSTTNNNNVINTPITISDERANNMLLNVINASNNEENINENNSDDDDCLNEFNEETTYSRLMMMLDVFVKQFIEESPQIKTENGSHEFRACDVHKLAQTHFPLCMRQIDSHLRKMRHLKHNGRFTFSLFLKAIGLSLEESMSYFASLMTEKTNTVCGSAETFEKTSYGYNIRHNYGLEGKKTNYTSASCATLLSLPPIIDKYDCHGCPFRFRDEHAFRMMLATPQHNPFDENMPAVVPTTQDIEDIVEDCKGQHYTRACYKYFIATHPNSRRDTLFRSPYEYFHTSVESEKANCSKKSTSSEQRSAESKENEYVQSINNNCNSTQHGENFVEKRQSIVPSLHEGVTRVRNEIDRSHFGMQAMR